MKLWLLDANGAFRPDSTIGVPATARSACWHDSAVDVQDDSATGAQAQLFVA